MPFFSTYGVSSFPLGFGYLSMRVFDFGWLESFGGQGFYWLLVRLGGCNQWFQYNGLRAFLGFFMMWFIILVFGFLYYLNSLCLERDTEDVNEVILPLSIYKSFLYFYSESVMFCLNYINLLEV
jgi:hypothetical protein